MSSESSEEEWILSHKQIKATLSNFELTDETFEEDIYQRILDSLENLATLQKYFTFSANQLLKFSSLEIKMGIYRGQYKALPNFISLFNNSGTKTKVSLEERMRYLTEKVDEIVKEDDDEKYAQIEVIIKTLGVAADVFETGEYDSKFDPYILKYIDTALECLMRFAGSNDEDGLSSSAEDELHKLLKSTIDEPEILGASDTPFFIFKLYYESKREWNEDPVYYLDTLKSSIEDSKKKRDIYDNHYIQMLERRLELLVSLYPDIEPLDRVFIGDDFKLTLMSKTERKSCEIGVGLDAQMNLELHARQSLAERLIFKHTSNLHSIDRGWPKCTYIIVNIGFVVSNMPQFPRGLHKRQFVTIPIKIVDFTIFGRANQRGGHAEEGFFEYLLQDDVMLYYLKEFKKQFHINSPNHKVYAVILDFHGTYDMCLSCSELGLKFQNQFRAKLLKFFVLEGLKTLRKCPGQLPIIIRYSSDIKYHFPDDDRKNKQGTLVAVTREGLKRDLGVLDEKALYNRNIKYFSSNLLVHGKSNWHSFWSEQKRKEYTGKPINVESWTAFASDGEYNNLEESEKHVNYTLLGKVETEVADLPEIGNLKL